MTTSPPPPIMVSTRPFAISFSVNKAIAIRNGCNGDAESLPEVYAERETAPRERKPLEDFVFQGQWGRRPDFLGSV